MMGKRTSRCGDDLVLNIVLARDFRSPHNLGTRLALVAAPLALWEWPLDLGLGRVMGMCRKFTLDSIIFAWKIIGRSVMPGFIGDIPHRQE